MKLRYPSERSIPKNDNEDIRTILHRLDSSVFITNLEQISKIVQYLLVSSIFLFAT